MKNARQRRNREGYDGKEGEKGPGMRRRRKAER